MAAVRAVQILRTGEILNSGKDFVSSFFVGESTITSLPHTAESLKLRKICDTISSRPLFDPYIIGPYKHYTLLTTKIFQII